MLLQGDGAEIRLPPALQTAWPAGRVTGLRVRGGFEIDLTWNNSARAREGPFAARLVTGPEQPHGELSSGALARLFSVILMLPGRPFGAKVRRILDAINSRFVICNNVPHAGA
jgi:hypothetical protein